MAETNMTWVQVLPLALMYMRGRTHATLGLSPYEILMGRPMRMTNMPFPQNKMTLMNIDDEMIKYCLALNNVLKGQKSFCSIFSHAGDFAVNWGPIMVHTL